VNAALVRFCGPIKKKLKVQSREVRFWEVAAYTYCLVCHSLTLSHG
jgi:hypothetical protein